MRIRDPGWRHFGSRIRDGKKSDPGSGINIPDPQHWFVQFKTRDNKIYNVFSAIMVVLRIPTQSDSLIILPNPDTHQGPADTDTSFRQIKKSVFLFVFLLLRGQIRF
jgi:hypothetical protein